jgi:predicted nucleotidyltransferase
MGVRYADRTGRAERLRRELREIVARIVDDDTERVLLFGSAARGQVTSRSDLDVLVVRRDDRPPAARADDLYRRARPRVALDLLVYTPEELQVARASSSFLRTALREAQVVYERSRPVA